MLKVLIATGGTGGHLFPAQQLQAKLADCQVLFAGHKLKDNPFFDTAQPYQEILSSAKKTDLFSLAKGVWQSIKMIRAFQPDVVVGFGSFHSFPILMAAVLLRKKIILFEANVTLGQVNRLFAPFASHIALQFPVPLKKGVIVPLLPWTGAKGLTLNPEQARASYGLSTDTFTILVFGGSQGAVFINRVFCQAARLIPFPCQIIHLTGKEDLEINYPFPSVVKPFEKEMNRAYAAADLVVCRCGAGTVAELIRYQKPALLIPYPYAYDHQRKNGEFLKKGAHILPQNEATPERLAEEVVQLKQTLEMRKEALQQIVFPQTTDLGELVRSVGGKQ